MAEPLPRDLDPLGQEGPELPGHDSARLCTALVSTPPSTYDLRWFLSASRICKRLASPISEFRRRAPKVSTVSDFFVWCFSKNETAEPINLSLRGSPFRQCR